tara:strand:- start:559 stop:831 length:273 start_codon:yes stop_codon:yes gene_type:complete
MIGLIILGLVLLIYYGRIKFFKPTSEAVKFGVNKNLILYGIHNGIALGLSFVLPIIAIFPVSEWLLLLVMFLAILSEFIKIYFYIFKKEL